MEQQVNPYEAGQAHQQGYVDSSSNIPVTPVALGALMGTKVWVSLVGIMMLIIVGVNLLVLLFADSQRPVIGGVFVVYMIPFMMFVLQVVLAVRLIQYGTAIGRLSNGGTNEDFERAMVVQSKFWKLFGIICILMIAIMILSVLFVIMSFGSRF